MAQYSKTAGDSRAAVARRHGEAAPGGEPHHESRQRRMRPGIAGRPVRWSNRRNTRSRGTREESVAITVQAITPDFAAEVGDVALDRPLAPEDLAAIRAAFSRFAVLVFPDQELDDESQLAFARHFGPLETTVFKSRQDHKLRLHENLADVSNLDAENRILERDDRQRLYNLGNQLWHTDSSFKRVPAYCSMLHARSIPPIGGQTEFADLRAAYDALPEATRQRIAGLVAEHSIMTSRARLGFTDFDATERATFRAVPQVVARRLPDSGRMSLYIASHAGSIRGLSDADARALLDELTRHATQRQFVYAHRWRVKDLVIWDDRCTMHRGMPFDDQRYRRDMRRATVSDVAPTCEQMGLAVAAE
jgi:alpha-ketoglutarate-dependent 2,4-dichlorophenoxyacetate dioxygenase